MDHTTADRRARAKLFLACVAIVGCCLALAVLRTPMLYLTNDDAGIQAALAGNNTGTPYPLHRFVGFLASYAISALYGLVPTVQWWYVYSLALILVGMVLILYGMLLVARRRGAPTPTSIALALLVSLAVLFFPISQVSFTTVPSIVVAGVLSWYVGSPRKETLAVRIPCAMLYLMALSHRDASAMAGLAFIVVGVLFAHMDDQTSFLVTAKKAAPFVVTLAAITAIVVPANKAIQARNNTPEAQAYNHARVRYMDYPHDTYDQNPELYQSVGWDRTLYALVDDWCFLDERVTTDAFLYLHENSEATSLPTQPASIVQSIDAILDNATQAKICLVACGLTGAAALVLALASRSWRALVAWLLQTVCAGALLCYQFAQGRILYRSLFVVLLPCLVLNVLLLLSCYDRERHRTACVACVACVLIGLMPLAYRSVRAACDMSLVADGMHSSEVEARISAYAIDHPDTLFIKQKGVSDNRNPRALYPDAKPSNVFLWGGSQFVSSYMDARLAYNGIGRLDGTVFRDQGALLVSSEDIQDAEELLDEDSILYQTIVWQRERYGAVGIVQVDAICPGAYAYRFVFEDAGVG